MAMLDVLRALVKYSVLFVAPWVSVPSGPPITQVETDPSNSCSCCSLIVPYSTHSGDTQARCWPSLPTGMPAFMHCRCVFT